MKFISPEHAGESQQRLGAFHAEIPEIDEGTAEDLSRRMIETLALQS